MAKKSFDILPPYPEKKERVFHRESLKVKKKRKSQSLFIVILLTVFLVLLFYIFIKAGNQSYINSKTKTTQGNFELFNSNGDSSFTSSTGLIRVKILYNSTSNTDAITIRDIFLNNGFEIENLNQAVTNNPGVYIYYKKNERALANKAYELLKNSFPVNIQESSNLASDYDLLVVAGSR